MLLFPIQRLHSATHSQHMQGHSWPDALLSSSALRLDSIRLHPLHHARQGPSHPKGQPARRGKSSQHHRSRTCSPLALPTSRRPSTHIAIRGKELYLRAPVQPTSHKRMHTGTTADATTPPAMMHWRGPKAPHETITRAPSYHQKVIPVPPLRATAHSPDTTNRLDSAVLLNISHSNLKAKFMEIQLDMHVSIRHLGTGLTILTL